MSIDDFDQRLDQYADMLIRSGLNLRSGQRLLIGSGAFIPGAPLETAPLVRALAAKAYQAGARFVDVIWDDEALTLSRFQHAPRDSFLEYATWKPQLVLDYVQHGDALLEIYATNPDLLKGQDSDLIGTMQKHAFELYKSVSDLIELPATNWLVVSAPTEAWAARVLPNVPAHERVNRMWDIIFEMCHVTGDDPVAGWRDHVRRLLARSDYLNDKQYDALHYSAPGTDLTVGLPQNHIWRSGALEAQNGILFTANIPTEEVFTMPHKDRVNGTITATKPLSISGATVEGFQLTFEGGRVVGTKAKRGEDHLRRLIETDDGARQLGEVALVPHSSPISASGLQFYNILYDENASNHLAFGAAYRFSLQGGESMTVAEFMAAGGNESLIHVDFMVGSSQMDIDGIRSDGGREAIFRQGEWAFVL